MSTRSDLEAIRKEDRTYLSLLPKDIFQLVVDYYCTNYCFIVKSEFDLKIVEKFIKFGYSYRIGENTIFKSLSDYYHHWNSNAFIIHTDIGRFRLHYGIIGKQPPDWWIDINLEEYPIIICV